MPDDKPVPYDIDEWKRAVFERKEEPENAVFVKEAFTEDEEKQIDLEKREVRIAFSSSSVDRDGDVISQKGIDLKNFKKNPVVLFAHGGGFFGGDADIKLPIATATKLEMNQEKTKSFATDVFVPRDMPVVGELAEANFQMLTTKLPGSNRFIMNAASIGFRPKKFIERELEDDEKDQFFFALNFEKVEKLEHSIVPIPSNPDALRAAKQAGIELHAIKEWAEGVLDSLGPGERFHPNYTREQLEKAWDISNGEKKSFLAAIFDGGTSEKTQGFIHQLAEEIAETKGIGVVRAKRELVRTIDELVEKEDGMKTVTDLEEQLKRFEFPEDSTKQKSPPDPPARENMGAKLETKLDELLDVGKKTNKALAILVDAIEIKEPADPPAEPKIKKPADDDPIVFKVEDDSQTKEPESEAQLIARLTKEAVGAALEARDQATT